MYSHTLLQLLFVSLTLLIPFCAANQETFVQCMSNLSSSGYVHSPHSQSYVNLLRAAEQNLRWVNSTALEPKLIITPYGVDEIRAAIGCSKKHGMQIRVKSGGHDYEGLSYTCRTPFVLIDLVNLRSIKVDLEDETAWVQSGATIGELYYNIAQKSNVHGFPAGLCSTVGVGGHFSGGGFGMLLRKHGLAADNIIDAYIMDAQGYVLDRKSMGEDLFWAIRGGGGASFGIILSWKIKLIRVPPVVTVFSVSKHIDEEGIKLLEKWQNTASQLPEDLFIRVILQHIGNNKEPQAIFNSLFLGSGNELLPLMTKSFPELGLQGKDCMEMSWIESVLKFAGFKVDGAKEALLDRIVEYKSSFKAKSDYATKPMPASVFAGINERLMQEETSFVIMDPYGGRMDQILRTKLPFPHRKGNLFNIQYLVKWSSTDDAVSRKHVDWIRQMYDFMKPYVSSSPRAAYLNYRDLDLGINQLEKSNYSEATSWGTKYFKGNFKRLAAVKKVVDPDNFFRNEQSIPPLS